MEFLGNISLRLVGVLATVATLAAVYFFIVKPISDTTQSAFDSVAPAFKQLDGLNETIEKSIAESNEALEENPGNPALKGKNAKLLKCLQAVQPDTAKMQRCANRYAPQ